MSLPLLIKKEVLTLLREPAVIIMILVPLILYPALGVGISKVRTQVEEAARLKGVRIAVVPANPREEAVARLMVEAARSHGINVTLSHRDPLKLLESGYDVVIFVPCGFTYNITHGRNATLMVYVSGTPSRIMSLMTAASSAPLLLARLAGLGGAATKVHVAFRSYFFIHGRFYSVEDISRLVLQSQVLLEGAFFLAFIAASQSAVIMGYEREERTLEVLLSLPIPRRNIAVAKIVSSILVALLATISILVGLYAMFASSLGESAAKTLGFKLYTPLDAALLAAAMAVTAFFTAAAAQLLALFTESVRGAQAATMIIVFPAIFVMIGGMFGLILAPSFIPVPYAALAYAAYSPILDKSIVAASIGAEAVEAAIITAVLAKLLDTELAITGPRLLKRLKRR